MTDQSARSEAVVALGKKLVTESGLGDSGDTLGRWMAHHIAELILEAESATSEHRPAKQAQLRDAVLSLWAHRFELSSNNKPFRQIEPILRALTSLDPERGSPRYLFPSLTPENPGDESKETQQWIEFANGLDYTSKVLINYCLALAAEAALDKSKAWVTLAEEAGIDDSWEVHVVRFMEHEGELKKERDLTARQRSILMDRKQKLEAFVTFASALANEMEARLNALPSAGEETAPNDSGQPN